jgi:hypothetical protein
VPILKHCWGPALLGLLLAGCTAPGQRPGAGLTQAGSMGLPALAGSPASPALPAPAELASPGALIESSPSTHVVAFTEGGLFRLGSQFEQSLPSNRVFIQLPGADFLPAFTPPDRLDHAA